MLRKLFASALAVSVLSTVGCIRSASLIKLNEDGSGELVEQVFLSPQITSMMGGGAAMMGEAAAELGAEPAEAPSMADQFREQAEAKVAELGEGVTLKEVKEASAPDGWKGYRATYTFADINTLTFTSDTQGKTEEEDGSSGQVKMKGFRYGFEYVPGKLKIVNLDKPAKPDEPADGAVAAAPAADEEDPFGGLLDGGPGGADAGGDAMAAGMMQAMGGMFAGMRVTVMVEVPKPIKETNASYPHPDNKRVITLNDLRMDSLIANPAAMAAMEKDDMAKIRAMNLPEVKIEDPSLDIEVSF